MKKLSAEAQSILNSGRVETFNQIKIKRQICNDVINYQYGYNKNFGSASARIRLNNQGGQYSPKGEKAIHWNDEIQIIEGIKTSSGYETFVKFTGLTRQTVPRMEKGISEIELTALDKIVRLEDLDLYDHFYEANKTDVGGYAGVKLKPINPTGEGYCQIFEFYDKNYDEVGAMQVADIAPNPIPRIRVRNLTTYLSDPKWEGFSITYETGQLILDVPIQTKDYEIFAIFSYYKTADGLYVEDLIRSIITAQDGYGNYPISENDIKTDLLTEDGVSIDTMVPNYTTETIDGTDYLAGQLWYLTYNNVITNLVVGNFTIPGGASFVSFNKRYGRIILDMAISVNSVVTCNINYQFYTIQATGIQTPYIEFPAREIPNRFEALNQIRQKLVAPNYIFQTRGSDKIWGRYINQKVKEDYELKLKEQLEYAPDQDIYTRVKLFGENANPTNLMRNLTSDDYEWGYEYIAEASEQQLVNPFTEGDWLCFEVGNAENIKLTQILSNPQPPEVYIDGVKYGTSKVLVSSNKDDIYWDKLWGRIIVEKDSGDKIEGLWFKSTVDMAKNINLYYWIADTKYTTVIYPDDSYMKFNYEKHRYEWKPNYSTTEFSLYIATDFYLNTSDSFEVDFERNLFRIKRTAVSEETVTDKILVGRDMGLTNMELRSSDIKKFNNDIDNDFASARTLDKNWGEMSVIFNDHYFIRQIKISPTTIGGEIRGTDFEIYLSTTDGWKQVYDAHQDTGIVLIPLAHKGEWVGIGPGAHYEQIDASLIVNLGKGYLANAIKLKFRDTRYDKGGYIKCGEIRCEGSVLHESIKAHFWYSANATMPVGIENLHDGLYGTQVQSIYSYEPLKGSIWATFDFGEEKNIQAIDLIAGFYIPDPNVPIRRYDTKMNLTLEYALNAPSLAQATFYEISKEATGFDLSSGDKVSFEPDELGENFKMRWLRIKIEDLDMIEALGKKIWVLALTELSIYSDIVISSECQLTNDQGKVDDNDYDNDTLIYYYDSKDLLGSVGDRIYKKREIDKILNTQRKLNLRAYNLLKEFVKENSKCSANTPIGCYIELGQTLKIIDPYSKAFSGQSQNYFVDSINVSGKKTTLVLARYE